MFFSFLLVPFVEARFTAAFFSGGFSDGFSFFLKSFPVNALVFCWKAAAANLAADTAMIISILNFLVITCSVVVVVVIPAIRSANALIISRKRITTAF